MKILLLYSGRVDGCVLYRQIIPHIEFHARGEAEILFTNATTYRPEDKESRGFSDDEIKQYDIIQYHKGYINLKEIERFKRLGVKVVCDFDDYWELPTSHGLFNEYNYVNRKDDGKTIFAKDENGMLIKKEKTTTDFLKEVLRRHEYITTTTPLLAEQIYPYNKNVEVFENALHPNSEYLTREDKKWDKMRFGWIGGSQHWVDIQLLRGFANKLNFDSGTKGKYDLRLFGYMGGTVYDNFVNIFTDYRKIRKPFLAFPPRPAMHDKDEPSYLQYYNDMDVALIPLADTKFNSMKSELKVVEAGFFKKPVIVSDIYPYTRIINDTNALIVKKPKDWFRYAKKLIHNPNMAKDLGEALYDAVKEKYNVIDVNERRLAWYKSIIKK